jgi:butyryl-CoA dehydrogenase
MRPFARRAPAGARADFRDAVCVITGAGSGLGRALAIELADRGARLELWDIDSARLEETSAALPQQARHTLRVIDVGHWDAVREAAADIERRQGSVDLVVNNAAIALCASVERATITEYERVFRTDLFGVVHGSKAFLPIFNRQGYGHIVNVSSVFAGVAIPTLSAYCAAKSAVSAFTDCLASETAASGVVVSLAIPAGLRTNLANEGSVGELADAAEREALLRIARRLRGDPREAAQRLLAGVLARKRHITTSPDAFAVAFLSRFFPATIAWWLRRLLGV